MLEFPQTTEFNKRIPKQKFYENLSVIPALKRIFVEQIQSIIWANKLAPTTISVSEGKEVVEIEVFKIMLNSKGLDEIVLKQIDTQIPYHILFILEYNEQYQVWIGYKELSSGTNAFKVNKYYHTDWVLEKDLEITINGLNMDDIYASFVRQIGGIVNNSKSLGEQVAEKEHIEKLEKEIAKLEKQARNERQPKKKFELVQKAKALKKQLELIHN